MELEHFCEKDDYGWWRDGYRMIFKKENKMINELKDGDRVEIVRAFGCMAVPADLAKAGEVGVVRADSLRCLLVDKDGGGDAYFYTEGSYDLTGCLRKITDTKELTVEQISKELGYDVKVVKG